ncbi:hypothetical protein LTR85_008381 [Meristemomyces frigidus]|nr:hypothetical protein LTR85_008381 [Meristemomyces frigidus]
MASRLQSAPYRVPDNLPDQSMEYNGELTGASANAADVPRPGYQHTILGVDIPYAGETFNGIWSAPFVCRKGQACEVCFPPTPITVTYHFVDDGDDSKDGEIRLSAEDAALMEASGASIPKVYISCKDAKCTICTAEANVRKWEEVQLQNAAPWLVEIERERNRRALRSSKGNIRGWRFGGEVNTDNRNKYGGEGRNEPEGGLEQ